MQDSSDQDFTLVESSKMEREPEEKPVISELIQNYIRFRKIMKNLSIEEIYEIWSHDPTFIDEIKLEKKHFYEALQKNYPLEFIKIFTTEIDEGDYVYAIYLINSKEQSNFSLYLDFLTNDSWFNTDIALTLINHPDREMIYEKAIRFDTWTLEEYELLPFSQLLSNEKWTKFLDCTADFDFGIRQFVFLSQSSIADEKFRIFIEKF